MTTAAATVSNTELDENLSRLYGKFSDTVFCFGAWTLYVKARPFVVFLPSLLYPLYNVRNTP